MIYNKMPVSVCYRPAIIDEFMFYQYLPIKLRGDSSVHVEDRLVGFHGIIGVICCDYIGVDGLDKFVDSNVYLTAKNMFYAPGASFNRPGWHSDGFMTEDINYIWASDKGTVFNGGPFDLTLDDEVSLVEMATQADERKSFQADSQTIYRLNQYCIHRSPEVNRPMTRAFLKVSFSKDKYDLLGNSHNHLIDYEWKMRPRSLVRNIPNETV